MQHQQTFCYFIKNTAIISSVQKGYIIDIGRIQEASTKTIIKSATKISKHCK